MLPPSVIDAFARSYDPPHFAIEKLLLRGPEAVRSTLQSAVDAVTAEEIAALDADLRAHAEAFLGSDPDSSARLFIVSRQANRLLQGRRLQFAKQGADAPPYDHPALAGVVPDSEGLVPLSAFEIDGDSLCRNGHSFFMLPAVPAMNANYWLLAELERTSLVDSVRVRLDPLLWGPANELRGRFYKATIYGRDLDWERVRSLRNVDHGRWAPGRLSRGHLFTDYAWVPHEQEVDFLCEELPVQADIDVRGSRYAHAIYDKQRHEIVHLDGAIRIMDATQFTDRVESHVYKAGKTGFRVKTFRTDRPVTPATLGSIVEAFFFWNFDVARYFGAPLHPDL